MLLHNLVNRDLDLFLRPVLGSQKVNRYPLTNLGVGQDDTLHIEVAVAGFDKSDIQIEQKGNRIHILGSKTKEVSDEGDENGIQYIQQHISSSNFERVVVLQENYVGGNISANVKNGILSIVVQPNEPTRKLIQIGN